MDKKTRTRIMKYLYDFKAELVAYLESEKATIYSKEISELQKKADEAEEMIKDHPMWISMQKRFSAADEGDYIKPFEYSKEEMEFARTNNYYKEMEKARVDQYELEEKWRKQFSSQLKHGKASSEGQKIFDEAGMKIWSDAKEYFGTGEYRQKGYEGNPMITFDSIYYEILNNYWGFKLAEQVTNTLNEKLESIGYSIEPYDYSTWVVV